MMTTRRELLKIGLAATALPVSIRLRMTAA
jgi:hypothetical protein